MYGMLLEFDTVFLVYAITTNSKIKLVHIMYYHTNIIIFSSLRCFFCIGKGDGLSRILHGSCYFIILFLVQEESDAASSFSSMSAYKPMVGSKAFNTVSHTHTHVHIHTRTYTSLRN